MSQVVFESEEGLSLPVGMRREVRVLRGKDGLVAVQFVSPMEEGDIQSGEILPRATGTKQDGQLVTSVILSGEALNGLRVLLNQLYRTSSRQSS